MSAYGHIMEREYSAQSLSSRNGSELDSRYTVEPGFYIASYAAVLFIMGLVAVGVLLMTLLIALTVMLQSCQRKSDGVIKTWKFSDDLNYCKIFTLHSEINGFNASSFPPICKDVASQYIKEGQYMKDLNDTMWMIEKYFSSFKPTENGVDVVLMDADDLFPLWSSYNKPLVPQSSLYDCPDCINQANKLKQMILLKLYIKLKAGGWPLFLFSRKNEKLRNYTMKHLISAGFSGWSSLIMRSNNETLVGDFEYLSTLRRIIQEEGYHISAVISSQMDALIGPFSGILVFKFPNPMFLQATAL